MRRCTKASPSGIRSLPKKARGFPIVSVILFVGTWIESEHNEEMLAENERIV